MENKKLVAEWMGWKFYQCSEYDPVWIVKNPNESVKIEDWNPQDDKKATFVEWDEIYKNMDDKFFRNYIAKLLWNTIGYACTFSEKCLFPGHTASPSIRWKALVEMIKEGNENES